VEEEEGGVGGREVNAVVRGENFHVEL